MQSYIAVFALASMILCVFFRSRQMKKLGIKAMHFGKIDKSDFLLPPFALAYFYLVAANAFDLPGAGGRIGGGAAAAWTGAALCLAAPAIFVWGLVSFGESFRVGIDRESPGDLVTSGAFAFSRNPLYLAFFALLVGNFLVVPNWIFFACLIAGLRVIDRQVCREETELRRIYGEKYNDYCEKVCRYL